MFCIKITWYTHTPVIPEWTPWSLYYHCSWEMTAIAFVTMVTCHRECILLSTVNWYRFGTANAFKTSPKSALLCTGMAVSKNRAVSSLAWIYRCTPDGLWRRINAKPILNLNAPGWSASTRRNEGNRSHKFILCNRKLYQLWVAPVCWCERILCQFFTYSSHSAEVNSTAPWKGISVIFGALILSSSKASATGSTIPSCWKASRDKSDFTLNKISFPRAFKNS